MKNLSFTVSDVDEDGERITVRSDDELKAMFEMVGCIICTLNTCTDIG